MFFEFILSRIDLVLLHACPFLHVGLEFVHAVFHPTFFFLQDISLLFWDYFIFSDGPAWSRPTHANAICEYHKHLFYSIYKIAEEDIEGWRTLQGSAE